MLTEEQVKAKLLELGIHKDPSVVAEIVARLKQGASKHSIYSYTNTGDYPEPLAGINFVSKVAKLLDEGKLDWMFDELKSVFWQYEMVKESQKDQEANLGFPPNVDFIQVFTEAPSGWWNKRYQDDGLGEWRLKVTEKAEESIKDFGWSIGNLKDIGIPAEEALSMLQEYDALFMTRQSSVVVSGIVEPEKPEGARQRTYADYLEGLNDLITDGHPLDHRQKSKTTRYLRNYRGYKRYLYLNHLVYLLLKYPHARPHYKYACLATELYDTGIHERHDDIRDQGEDILRYEVWDNWKGVNRKAYMNALKKYQRSANSYRALKGRMERLLNLAERS